jgi:hypothetical protein
VFFGTRGRAVGGAIFSIAPSPLEFQEKEFRPTLGDLFLIAQTESSDVAARYFVCFFDVVVRRFSRSPDLRSGRALKPRGRCPIPAHRSNCRRCRPIRYAAPSELAPNPPEEKFTRVGVCGWLCCAKSKAECRASISLRASTFPRIGRQGRTRICTEPLMRRRLYQLSQGDQQTIYPSNGEGSRGLPATAQRTVSEPPSAFNNLPPGTSWRRTQGAALASIREFDWHLSENGVCPRA